MSTAKVVILCVAIALGALAAGWVLRDAAGGKSWNRPRGTADAAQVSFNVLSLDEISPMTRGTQKAGEDERGHYINTAMKLMRTAEFIDQVFLVKEVQDSQWYKSFRSQLEARIALDDAMEIERVEGTTLIRVSLVISPRNESDIILNKLAEQYIAWTADIANKQRELDIKAFRDQLNNAEKNLLRAQTERDDFRSLHDVSEAEVEIVTTALKEMDTELRKLTVDRNVLQAALDALNEDKAAVEKKDPKITEISSTIPTLNARMIALKKLHDEKQAEFRKQGFDLLAYRSREEAVNAARIEFNRAQSDFNRQDGILRSQQSRIQFVQRARPI